MTQKKILITGGSGFVGKPLIGFLIKKRPDLKIYNLDRLPHNNSAVTNILRDVTDFDLSEINTQFDYIIHLLALSHETYCKNLKHAIEINIDFTKKLMFFSLNQKNVRKLIYISSTILYDPDIPSPVKESSPISFFKGNYQFTKGVAENYVNFFQQKLNLPIIIFRLSNIYGPQQQIPNSPFLIPSKISQAINERRIDVLNTQSKKDWIYSEDAALAIISALDSDFNGILNLGSGKSFSIKNVIEIIAKNLNVKYYDKGLNSTKINDFYCDISKTKSMLKWKPTINLETGIKKILQSIDNKQNNI